MPAPLPRQPHCFNSFQDYDQLARSPSVEVQRDLITFQFLPGLRSACQHPGRGWLKRIAGSFQFLPGLRSACQPHAPRRGRGDPQVSIPSRTTISLPGTMATCPMPLGFSRFNSFQDYDQLASSQPLVRGCAGRQEVSIPSRTTISLPGRPSPRTTRSPSWGFNSFQDYDQLARRCDQSR